MVCIQTNPIPGLKGFSVIGVTSSGLVHLQGYHPAWLDDRLLRTASLHKLFQISRTNSEVNQTRWPQASSIPFLLERKKCIILSPRIESKGHQSTPQIFQRDFAGPHYPLVSIRFYNSKLFAAAT